MSLCISVGRGVAVRYADVPAHTEVLPDAEGDPDSGLGGFQLTRPLYASLMVGRIMNKLEDKQDQMIP